MTDAAVRDVERVRTGRALLARRTSPAPDEPPDDLVYRHRVNLAGAVRELWTARELLRTLVEREFRARYKQAFLGVAWAVITPLVYLVGFGFVFDRVAEVDTNGVPYSVFALVGLFAWTFFSSAVNRGATSLLFNQELLQKVHFPRESFPLSSVGVAGLDSAISLVAITVIFALEQFVPRSTSFWVVPLLAIQIAFTAGICLLLSVLVVHVRDVKHLVPMALQLGLFVTPIGWSVDSVSSRFADLYALGNPLVAVIDGYRSAVLLGEAPDASLMTWGAIGAGMYLSVGYWLFKRLETGVADVA